MTFEATEMPARTPPAHPQSPTYCCGALMALPTGLGQPEQEQNEIGKSKCNEQPLKLHDFPPALMNATSEAISVSRSFKSGIAGPGWPRWGCGGCARNRSGTAVDTVST